MIYLAAPHTDDDFRAAVSGLLERRHIEVFDPIAARDFRGREIDNEAEIVAADLADVARAALILGNYSVPGWGTAMETWYGYSLGKHVVAYVEPDARVSPWIAYVAGGWNTVARSVEVACARAAVLL